MLKVKVEFYSILDNAIKTKEYFLGRKVGVNAWHLHNSEDLGEEVPVDPLTVWSRSDDEVKELLDDEIFRVLDIDSGEFVTRVSVDGHVINYNLIIKIVDKVRKIDDIEYEFYYSYVVSIEHDWCENRIHAYYTPYLKEFKLLP